MANTNFDNLNKEYWANELQKTLFVENTAVFLAGTEPQGVLTPDGKKYHKPILSHAKTGTYTPGTDIDDKDLTATDASFEVDQMKYASVYVDDVHKRQNFYSAAENAAMGIQKQLNNRIEQFFLGKVTSADNTLDAGSVGGSAGSNIALDTSNVLDLFTAAHTRLDTVDAPMANRVAVVGPHTVGVMRKYKGQRETNLGDTALENGVIGPWAGWTIVQNNNLPWSASLAMATNPTDGDTVTIAGVTFEFQDDLDDVAAGNWGVLRHGSTAATSVDNLVAAINGTGTVGTDYVAPSAQHEFIIREKRAITATDNTTSIGLAGFGDIVVSETLTAAGNVFSAQLQDSVFMVRGAIELAVQLAPEGVEVTRVEKRFGDRIKALALYGAHVFADNARVLERVKIDASAWV